MKKIFNFIFLLISITVFSQIDNIKSGEKLTYRLHYGFLNAGTATLTTNQITYKGKPHYRVTGVGKSTGAVRAFFNFLNHFGAGLFMFSLTLFIILLLFFCVGKLVLQACSLVCV